MLDARRMKELVLRENQNGHVILWILILGAAIVLVHPWGDVSWDVQHPTLVWIKSHVYLTGFFAFLVFSTAGKAYSFLEKLDKTPLARADETLLGPYTPAEVQRMANDAKKALKIKGGEKANIFILRSPEANAMAANDYFLNGSPEKNAVYLNSFLLRTLDKDELKAVISHELSHFYIYMNPLTRAPFIVGIAVAVLLLAALEFVAIGLFHWDWIWGWGVVFAVMPLFFLLLKWVYQYARRLDRLQEFLADQAAAESCGSLSMINALLKIGSRQEILFRATEEILKVLEKNPNLGIEKALEIVRGKLPDRLLTQKEAVETVQKELKKIQEEDGEEKSGKNRESDFSMTPLDTNPETRQVEKKQRVEIIKKLKELFGADGAWRILHWETFDTHVADHKLDRAEARQLITTLKKDPGLMLFAVSSDVPKNTAELDHPTTKNRILFIADNCGLG